MVKDPKLFGAKAVVQVIIQRQVQVFGEFLEFLYPAVVV